MSKVFVLAPSGLITGGVECLFQLVDALRKNQVDAYIVFTSGLMEIPEEYRHFNVNVAPTFEDCHGNTVVLYEAEFHRIRQFKHMKICCYWLSVDNYFLCSFPYISPIEIFKHDVALGFKSLIYQLPYFLFKPRKFLKNRIGFSLFRRPELFHFAQSYYALDFLLKNGIFKVLPLFDPISFKFSEKNQKRRDLILYNPKKGWSFTKKLIKRFPEFHWVPLIGMNHAQMNDLMQTAKIYIDFGHHPGRDKIPREAVCAGLCIITGQLGSAKNNLDIPIPNTYKFDQHHFHYLGFKGVVLEILLNFEANRRNFNEYLSMVRQSEDVFQKQVKQALPNILENRI